MRLFILSIFSGIISLSFASQMDSLIQVYSTQNGVAKIKTFEKLCGKGLHKKDFETFDSLAPSAKQLCLELDSVDLYCYINMLHALAWKDHNDYIKAENMLQESLAWALKKDLKYAIPRQYLSLANCIDGQGRTNEATAYFLKAYDYFLLANETGNATKCLRNAAGAFIQLKNFEEANNLLQKAYSLNKKESYIPGQIYSLNAIIHLHLEQENCDSGEYYARQLEQIIDTFPPLYAKWMYKQIGKVEHCLGHYDKALSYYQKVKDIPGLSDPQKGVLNGVTSDALYKKKEYTRALSHIDSAIFLDKNNIKQLYKYHQAKANILSALGRNKDALESMTQAWTLKDSFLVKSNGVEITRLKKMYDTQKKDLEIAELEKQNIQDRAAKKQLWIGIILSTLTLVIASAFGLQYYRSSQKEKSLNESLAQQKEIIEQSLDEKEMLLKEVHHRVKNNLQLISSIFNLQSKFTKGKTSEELMNLAKTRINTLALIHEKFYQSNSLATVSVKSYVQELSQYLKSSYESGNIETQINYNLDDVYLKMDQLIPCGLVINEILANIYKHAFNSLDRGLISISGKLAEEDYILEIQDNGPGLPEDFDLTNVNSLGLKLVKQIVEYQMEGAFTMESNEGTCFTFNFKIDAS